jgi:phage FluMu protein Com
MSKEAQKRVELLPCPFCGCRHFKGKLDILALPKDGSGYAYWRYRCPKCKTEFVSPPIKTQQDANNWWNKRPNSREASEKITEWVPVSERLPEITTETITYILIQVKAGVLKDKTEIYKAYLSDHATLHFHGEQWNFKIEDVIAWMPMPQFYQPTEVND